MSKPIYWLWLATRPNVGAGLIRQLTQQIGTPEFLYGATREQLVHMGLHRKQVGAFCDKSLARAKQILADCEKHKIFILTIEDSAYPDRLREIPDPPPVLYLRGNLPNFDACITIVGTRHCSAYGVRMAERFAAGLAKAGFWILSGMAHGIDSAAHRGCLHAGGKTAAVLAGGVDICYPQENRFLMGDILLEGAVLSENPPGTPNEGFRFPIRNRILSGLAAGVLVVEAPARSGALITARTAFEQGREVFAVPGMLDVSLSAGCNRLIRDEIARIVTHPLDIVQELSGMLSEVPREEQVKKAWIQQQSFENAAMPKKSKEIIPAHIYKRESPISAPESNVVAEKPALSSEKIPNYLTGAERTVALAIADGADTVDAISEKTGLSASQISSILVLFELDGIVIQQAGRCRLCEKKTE